MSVATSSSSGLKNAHCLKRVVVGFLYWGRMKNGISKPWEKNQPETHQLGGAAPPAGNLQNTSSTFENSAMTCTVECCTLKNVSL